MLAAVQQCTQRENDLAHEGGILDQLGDSIHSTKLPGIVPLHFVCKLILARALATVTTGCN